MKYLEVDSRRRVSLGELAKADRYLVEQDDTGTIHLIPAVVMTLAQYNDIIDRLKESK